MKKLFALILAFSLLVSLAVPAFADSDDTDSDGLVRLSGELGTPENVRIDKIALVNPFYLEKPVVDCDHAKLVLSVTPKKGICTCNYYLYVKDINEEWHHVAVFKLTKNKANGKPFTYNLDFDDVETFVAAAIWPADKGMEFKAVFDYELYVDPDCVAEYDDEIPSPEYEVETKKHPITVVTTVPSEAYKRQPMPKG